MSEWVTTDPAFRTGSNLSLDGAWRWMRTAAPSCGYTDLTGEWLGYHCGCLPGHDGPHVKVADELLDEGVRLELMPVDGDA